MFRTNFHERHRLPVLLPAINNADLPAIRGVPYPAADQIRTEKLALPQAAAIFETNPEIGAPKPLGCLDGINASQL